MMISKFISGMAFLLWVLTSLPSLSFSADAKAPAKRAPEGMVMVKGGCYEMGDTFEDGDAQEKPVHTVCVGDFYLAKYLVTQKEWSRIMGYNPSYFKNCARCPVERVKWGDAQKYIDKLNRKTGKKYRLPTEAEWEYAARSGGKREKWAGISDESEPGDYAWHGANSGERTHPVGEKKPNGLGLYDMGGDVWEWMSDWFDPHYYEHSPKENPQGPSAGDEKVLRGGSWFDDPADLRASYRNGYPADKPSIYSFGFRLALSSSGN